ncbi:hypothetical protein BDR26DRAFT_904021 [Obelidium mucronatum]|nr:hypothetical protein BDR26DRAFT_904021 [Obelidium mucronatum]
MVRAHRLRPMPKRKRPIRQNHHQLGAADAEAQTTHSPEPSPVGGLTTENNPFALTPTRWDELKETVSIVAEIGAVLDEDGVDVYFLNRNPIKGVKGSSNEIIEAC